MKIESKIKRAGGTQILMGTTNYHFAPLADGAHVATVENEAHQDRFLSITEGFRMYRGDAEVPAAPVETKNYTDGTSATGTAPLPPLSPAQQDSDIEALYGSSTHPATFTIHGTEYSLGDIVAKAHAGSGLDVKEWNALSDDGRADLIDEQLDALAEAGPAKDTADTNGDGVVDNAEERAALAEQYKAKFGKNPHYNLGVAKLRAALEAA